MQLFRKRPRPITIAADLGTTNALLSRIAEASERQAHAWELFLAAAFDLQVDAEIPDEPAREALIDDERLAVVEELERRGITIPMEVYRGLGVDPPQQADKGEPREEEDDNEGERAPDADADIPTARRRTTEDGNV